MTEGVQVDMARVQSNILRFEVTSMPAGDFVYRCHDAGVHLLPNGRREVRAVTHLDVSRTDIVRALEVIRGVLAEAA